MISLVLKDARASLGILRLLLDPVDARLDLHDPAADLDVTGLARDGVRLAQHLLREEVERSPRGLGVLRRDEAGKLVKMTAEAIHFLGDVAALCKDRHLADDVLFADRGSGLGQKRGHAGAQSLLVGLDDLRRSLRDLGEPCTDRDAELGKRGGESLAFGRLQTLWRIILPQCVKRMIPPWMNWYAILTMSTPLISIVGVNDAMTLAQDALAAEQRSELLMPMYAMLLLFFFVYCYPIARWTVRLERRYAVKI